MPDETQWSPWTGYWLIRAAQPFAVSCTTFSADGMRNATWLWSMWSPARWAPNEPRVPRDVGLNLGKSYPPSDRAALGSRPARSLTGRAESMSWLLRLCRLSREERDSARMRAPCTTTTRARARRYALARIAGAGPRSRAPVRRWYVADQGALAVRMIMFVAAKLEARKEPRCG